MTIKIVEISAETPCNETTSHYIQGYQQYLHIYDVDVSVVVSFKGKTYSLTFQTSDSALLSGNPLVSGSTVTLNDSCDDDSTQLIEDVGADDWDAVYSTLQKIAQKEFDHTVHTFKCSERNDQLETLKTELLNELAETEMNEAHGFTGFADDEYDQLEDTFSTIADSYRSDDSNPYYVSSEDMNTSEVAGSFASEFINEREAFFAETSDPFEKLWKQTTGASPKTQYYDFVHLCHKHFLKEKLKSPVNVWHIEQNALKTIHEGRESIKSLCRQHYTNMENE